MAQGFTARPVFYGMLLAQCFAGSTLVEATLSAQSDAQNLTAFAAKSGSRGYKLALFNKAEGPVRVSVSGLPASHNARVWWLKAPAIDSLEDVTFGGSRVQSDGTFHPRPEGRIQVKDGLGSLDLPGYSAAYIEG